MSAFLDVVAEQAEMVRRAEATAARAREAREGAADRCLVVEATGRILAALARDEPAEAHAFIPYGHPGIGTCARCRHPAEHAIHGRAEPRARPPWQPADSPTSPYATV